MAQYRHALPQLGADVFLTDSGLETDLLYNQGVELDAFAAFPLLTDPDGVSRLRAYYVAHAKVAVENGVGFVLEAPTWRANSDWGALLEFDASGLDAVNRQAVELLVDIRDEFADADLRFPISGCLGPRADGYHPEAAMSVAAAQAYHRPQIETLADTEADLVSALTLPHPAEAIGIARAAREVEMPVVLSFTVETDGNLPDGTPLGEAVQHVDAETEGYPAYYMINCAHPSHFAPVLESDAPWLPRIKGIRANASTRSHAELDEATDFDSGNPVTFGESYAQLRSRCPGLTVLGGCCGTDIRHIRGIARAGVLHQ